MPYPAQHRNPKFPIEILDEIIIWTLADNLHEFSAIAGFSLASYAFRQVALRHYFGRLYAHSKETWFGLCRIPGVFDWVRELDGLSIAILSNLSNLLHFHNLRHLSLDFSPEGIHTQNTCIRKLLPYIPNALTLISLELTYLPRVTVDLLTRIARTFPGLKTLRVSCAERLIGDCCWECYEESSSCTVHSPIPDDFVDVDDLAYAFGIALRPLKGLEDLHLGIYLSDLELFYYHILHSQMTPTQPASLYPSSSSLPPAMIATTGTKTQKGKVYNWPHAPNECRHCRDTFGDEVRTTELYAGAAIARYLPSLKTVTWRSFFMDTGDDGDGEPGDGEEQTTTMWVLRKDRKVKVRRAPW